MRTACLDGGKIGSKRALHLALAEQLAFPDWYGCNLDALHDLLCAEREPVRIVIRDRGALEAALGAYFRAFLALLDALAAEGRVSLAFDKGGPCADSKDLV